GLARSDDAGDPELRPGLLGPVGRRQPDAAAHGRGRPRRDLRDRQLRPARDRGDDPRGAGRRLEAGARAPLEALPALPRDVHGDEPHPGQGDDGDAGHDPAGVSLAHVPHGRRESPAPRIGARVVRPPQALTRRRRWPTSWSPAPPGAWAAVSSRSSRPRPSCAWWARSKRPGMPRSAGTRAKWRAAGAAAGPPPATPPPAPRAPA